MLPFVKTNANNKILKQLISTNCLSFGRNPKLNNKKINHYIFGTRQRLDIFKLYEMRYLLLRIYPIIHNLFLQARLNKAKKKKWFFEKNFDFQTKTLPKAFRNFKNFEKLKDKFNKTLKEKTQRVFLPKILFATTTEIYSEILTSAAKKCRMPFHVNRWLSGSITAGSFNRNAEESWSFLTQSYEEKLLSMAAQKKFFKNKKIFEVQKNKIEKYQRIQKPTLIIIPDISNNEMILKETNSLGIPVLGLVNSHCHVEIAYPIFANDFSLYSVHFFCHFLSSLILKEFIKYKKSISIQRKNISSLQFVQWKKDVLRFQKRTFFKKTSKEQISILQNQVYKKKTEHRVKYSFKGKYFVEHFLKARRQIKKNLRNNPLKRKIKKKFLLLKIVSPKKLTAVENWKRLKKNRTNFYLKKRFLTKMKLIQKLRAYNFSKIIKEIRLPENKPKFRYWNQRKFWFAMPIRFATSLPFWYTFKKLKLKKLLRRKIWDAKQKHKKRRNVFWKKKKNHNFLWKEKYRKRWSTKKTISTKKITNFKNIIHTKKVIKGRSK